MYLPLAKSLRLVKDSQGILYSMPFFCKLNGVLPTIEWRLVQA